MDGARDATLAYPDRDTALDATLAGWAADVAQGSDAAMYAWRRANVAELNRRGRQPWEALGRLSGPELVVGTTGYRARDPHRHPGPGSQRRGGHLRVRDGPGRRRRPRRMVATVDEGGSSASPARTSTPPTWPTPTR